ncbi:FecR family protein [Pseudodesulfovibrio portus]|uniref:FecR protein domain-containing protein n=1 Tax=Pseudodesulfovibrio portus TaxID=231439 RepID=A0ABM8ASA4_9BACT|nr:FecR family protein [Pseudodesulfovibrio portus]BDQ34356.1 hypothetical protein JCM14722_18980 [Pseudodesulfovibrio portus]
MLMFLDTSFTMAPRPTTIYIHALFAFLLSAGLLLCGPAMAADSIGAIRSATGECSILRDGDTLTAEVEQPVMLNDEVSTGENAQLSIVFLDETVLTLAESSHAAIDNYVYSDDASNLLFKFTKGTFRTITGTIVKQNPEGFNMQTPLATIGIRGSDVYAIVQPEGEEAGALHLGESHALEVSTPLQTVRITESGLRVRIAPTGLIFAPTRIPPSIFNTMLNIGSATPAAPSGGEAATPGTKSAPAKTRSGTTGEVPTTPTKRTPTQKVPTLKTPSRTPSPTLNTTPIKTPLLTPLPTTPTKTPTRTPVRTYP